MFLQNYKENLQTAVAVSFLQTVTQILELAFMAQVRDAR